MDLLWPGVIATGLTAGAAGLFAGLRRRNLHLWLPESLLTSSFSGLDENLDAPLDVYLAVCDHFEPEWGRPGKSIARERVDLWRREYPRQFGRFHDSDGRPPQHTFFFPADEYAPEYLDPLAELCGEGYGDVDIHLHHDHDTADNLRRTLLDFKQTLHDRHGLLRRDAITGEIQYGFIHGNWALCNARPDGRWCGVNEELTILRETGCYADFTLPSAPSDTQTRTINSIYYAQDIPGRPKSHDTGTPARVGQLAPIDQLLLVQGPLLLNWQNRKRGLFPRIENGDLTAANPPTWERLQLWLRANVHVTGAPRSLFVKLHTHGCKSGNDQMWLSGPAAAFHNELARQASRRPNFRYHYVTAWEMAQLVHRLEQPEPLPARSFSRPSSRILDVERVICHKP